MNRRIRAIALLSAGSVAALSALLGLRSAASQETAEEPSLPPFTIYSAPSHVPAGEHWVILGSNHEIPSDFMLSSLAGDVLDIQALSARAVAVRVSVPATGGGNLFRAHSMEKDLASVEIPIERGQSVPALSAQTNVAAGDFTPEGMLVSPTGFFLYRYAPASEGGLGRVKLHNRATGEWQGHDHLREREEKIAAGLLDPEAVEPWRDESVGLRLAFGENLIDILAEDELGNASWSTLTVYSTAPGTVSE